MSNSCAVNAGEKPSLAGLIEVSPGPGGTVLAKRPEQISLWDIFAAVETDNTDVIFKFHENASPYCPVGGNIYGLLYAHLDEAVAAMRKELSDVSLAVMLGELHQKVPDLSQAVTGRHIGGCAAYNRHGRNR